MARKKKNDKQEELELDQAYVELTGYKLPSAKKQGIGPVVLGLCLTCLLLAVCAFGLPYLMEQPKPTAPPTAPWTDAKIWDGVTVAGIPFGGKSRQEAVAALNQLAQDLFRQDLTVSIADNDHVLPAATAAMTLDTAAALEALMTFTGTKFDLLPYLRFDRTAIQSWITGLPCPDPVEPVWEVVGDQPELTSEQILCQTLRLTAGRLGYTVDAAALFDMVLYAYNSGIRRLTFEPVYTAPGTLDLQPVYDRYFSAPVDAVMDMETFEVTEGAWGYDFDLAAAQSRLDAAAYGEILEIPFRLTAPEITGDSLRGLLFRDVLGSCSSSHTWDDNRTNNLIVACQSLNGLVLYPGDSFSYNDTLGERTWYNGYLPAGSYGAEGIEETVGGGICQVSSNLYYSVLLAELEVLERTCHGYTVAYVPLGLDATVNWGTLDLRFRNNTDYPVRIDAWVADGYVHIRLVGTDLRDHYVELDYDILSEYAFDTVIKEYPPDNEEGYVDGEIITYGSYGFRVDSYKYRFSKETDELLETIYIDRSYYEPMNRIEVRIAAPEPSEEPTENTEAPDA